MNSENPVKSGDQLLIITVKKSWSMFRLTESALWVLCAGICALFPGSIAMTLAASLLLSAIWTIYYYRLEYSNSHGVLKISSGILFRKHRLLPPENVLWETRLLLPPFKRSSIVTLHTSGGRAVIFGEYSTTGIEDVENSAL